MRKSTKIGHWFSRLAGLSLATAPALTCQTATTAPGREGDVPAIRLSVVGTNDLHGHVEVLPTLGGYLNNLRTARAKDGAVLLLDGGDMFQGTLASNLTEGQVVVQAYNKLGYTAVTVGNHEFDFGPAGTDTAPAEREDRRGALRARANEANFPFLVANVFDDKTGKPLHGRNLFPTKLIRVKGISVGLVGVTTIDTPKATLASTFLGLSMRPLAETIIEHAKALRAQGAKVVLVLAHAGGSCARFDQPTDLGSCKTAGAEAEIIAVARALPQGLVDAIVAGHTHAGMAHTVANVPIIEAYSSGRAFGRVDLLIDSKSHRVVQHQLFAPQNLCRGHAAKFPAGCQPFDYEGSPVTPDPLVAQVAAEAERAVAKVSEQSLQATAATVFHRDYDAESALGNLFVDLMRAARPAADVALTNGGGIRKDLPAGPVKYGSLYEVVPFDNTFALAKVRADLLAKVFAHNLGTRGGFLSQSGLRINSRCVGNEIKVDLLRENGKPIAADEELTIVTNNFLATGGDGAFKGMSFTIEDAPAIRDELARVLRERGDTLTPAQFFSSGRPRHIYPGERPVWCH